MSEIKLKEKQNLDRLVKVQADYGAYLQSEIKKGVTKGFIFGYFAWEVKEGSVEIEFLN
jgi:hypothetical protein